MNEDTFNMEIRKFLKKVGVTSQREIGHAVLKTIEDGMLNIVQYFPLSASNVYQVII